MNESRGVWSRTLVAAENGLNENDSRRLSGVLGDLVCTTFPAIFSSLGFTLGLVVSWSPDGCNNFRSCLFTEPPVEVDKWKSLLLKVKITFLEWPF